MKSLEMMLNELLIITDEECTCSQDPKIDLSCRSCTAASLWNSINVIVTYGLKEIERIKQ